MIESDIDPKTSDAKLRSEELARQRRENLCAALVKKRAISIGLAIIVGALGALAWASGLHMVGFCLVTVALIFLVRYFDANGHLHEVRRRSSKRLAPDSSLLGRNRERSDQEGGATHVPKPT